jgi:transcriptional regulator with XRE-family HTH domain
MPQVSKLNLPAIDFGGETLGQRIARIRKDRGFTQVELSEKIGIIQSIVSAIERDERKMSAEMAVRFALALSVNMDELLAPAQNMPKGSRKSSRKVLRRLEQIEDLPRTQQVVLLRTIDIFLENAALKNARR